MAKVVGDFKTALPAADIYVYDNNSTDKTVELARAAGAIVRHEYRQGKGCVMRSMFAEIEADIYVLVDGDDTYPAEDVPPWLQPFGRGGQTLPWATAYPRAPMPMKTNVWAIILATHWCAG